MRAWLDGDWSVTLGAFFDCWDTKRHVIPPFEIPKDWMRFRSMDWGSASPFSVGWWAIVQDDYQCDSGVLPRGCMVRYREWYGMRPGEPNVGLKLHAEEVGKGIPEREKDESITYGVLDPSAFAEDGGPSIAERIGTGTGGKIWFRQADNTRVRARRHRRLGSDAGAAGRQRRRPPMLVVFSTCIDFIRTVPFLQHDPDRHEDVMTDSEDHAADECTLCLHVAAVGAGERGAEAGAHQRLPALPDGRAAGGLADVLSFLSGQIGFSLQGMTCSHVLSVKRVGLPEAMQLDKLPSPFSRRACEPD